MLSLLKRLNCLQCSLTHKKCKSVSCREYLWAAMHLRRFHVNFFILFVTSCKVGDNLSQDYDGRLHEVLATRMIQCLWTSGMLTCLAVCEKSSHCCNYSLGHTLKNLVMTLLKSGRKLYNFVLISRRFLEADLLWSIYLLHLHFTWWNSFNKYGIKFIQNSEIFNGNENLRKTYQGFLICNTYIASRYLRIFRLLQSSKNNSLWDLISIK